MTKIKAVSLCQGGKHGSLVLDRKGRIWMLGVSSKGATCWSQITLPDDPDEREIQNAKYIAEMAAVRAMGAEEKAVAAEKRGKDMADATEMRLAEAAKLAVSQERERVEAEKKKVEDDHAAEKNRRDDIENIQLQMNKIAKSLCEHVAGLGLMDAGDVVSAINEGKIPGVSISYKGV